MVQTTPIYNPIPYVFMETIKYANTNVLKAEVELQWEKPTSEMKGPQPNQLTLTRSKLVKNLVYFEEKQVGKVYDW